MKKSIFLSTFIFSLALSCVSFAAEEVQLGEATYSGHACPIGALTIDLGQEKRSAKIEFNSLLAQAGAPAQKGYDLQECDIQFPVQVPAGYRVAIAPVNYSMSVSLPYGTMTQLHLNYYFQYTYGISQQNFQFRWWGEQVKDYGFSYPKKESAPFWSNCGEDMTIRMNINLMAQTNRFNHEARISLNKLEGFELRVEKCTSSL